MAGEEGFEPSNAGIKIRCLNQLGDSPAEKPVRPKRRILPARNPLARIMRTPRADVVRASLRQSPAFRAAAPSTAARASDSEANGANTHPPDPVIRALGDRSAQRRKRQGNVRKSCNRGRLQVIAPITLGKDVHFRRRAVPCQFRRREDRRGGHGDRGHDHGDPERRQRTPVSGARRCRAPAPARRRGRTERRRPARRRCA